MINPPPSLSLVPPNDEAGPISIGTAKDREERVVAEVRAMEKRINKRLDLVMAKLDEVLTAVKPKRKRA